MIARVSGAWQALGGFGSRPKPGLKPVARPDSGPYLHTILPLAWSQIETSSGYASVPLGAQEEPEHPRTYPRMADISA